MRAWLSGMVKVTAVAAVAFAATGCGGSEEAMVTVKYTLDPSKGLPPGLSQVAILPAETGPATDPKWSDMTSDLLGGLVEQSREKFGTNLRVADRVETKKVFAEADLDAAGLVQGGGGAPAQLLGAQAFIISKINIKTSEKKTKKTVISGISGYGWSHGGGGSADTEEREKINQTITAQAKFQLVDAKTGESWTMHEDNVQSSEETDPGMFMGIGGSSDLSTEDEIAGVLVERVAREFMAKLVPIEVVHEVAVQSSGNKASAKGVSLLRADMYRDALSNFETALVEDPDDHKTLYAAGVACEALGEPEKALDYYRKACVAKDDERYLKAKKRLDADLKFMRKSS